MMDAIADLKRRIDELLAKNNRIVVGIDGQCAAGKTTLAKVLLHTYDCNVFHMDDFFLRPEQRTEERYTEIGGNVDYERFHDEVILPLMTGSEFAYRPYDCHAQTLKPAISVIPKALNIVEGSYALHPYNAFAFDFSVCLTIGSELQKERLQVRNPELYHKFTELWIPMENAYFMGVLREYRFDKIIRAEEMMISS